MNSLAGTEPPIKRGVIILGSDPLAAETLAAAEACDEVFVVARAVADEQGSVVDEDRANTLARARLERIRRRLRPHGVVVRGIVVAASPATARTDAEALYPGAPIL